MRLSFEMEHLRSVAYDGQTVAGYCSFEAADGVWHVMHTVVHQAYQGRGLAKKLVVLLLENAEDQGVKVQPVCSYVQAFFEKDASFRHLLQ